jgi:hypothetical protein
LIATNLTGSIQLARAVVPHLGFYEAFAREVEPFGIRTTLVEPGMIRTSF